MIEERAALSRQAPDAILSVRVEGGVAGLFHFVRYHLKLD